MILRAIHGGPDLPRFREHVPAAVFSFREEPRWTYGDRRRPMVDAFSIPTTIHDRHLLLCDQESLPRFALGWNETRSGDVVITNLQRLHTRYRWKLGKNLEARTPERAMGWSWSRNLETKAQHVFRAHLEGVHPAEFLLLEFIWRHREVQGMGLCPAPDEYGGRNYHYLLEHYFEPELTERQPLIDSRLRVRAHPLRMTEPLLYQRFFSPSDSAAS